MAIPNSPDWSSLTDVKAYPQPAFAKPATPAGVAAVSLGPIALNDSQGVLNSRYWLVVQDTETGNVEIAGAVGAEWDLPAPLFSEVADVEQITLTFDQLGRPLVFYRTGADTLKLYWYDPVIQESVNVTIATGVDPLAGFDFPQDTGQSFSDALLFYVRADTVHMRVQRDRFATEYVCPASGTGLRLISNGLRVDNRYQVVYQYQPTEYVPPIVPPPVIPVTDGYLLKDGTLFISNKIINVVTDVVKIGFTIVKIKEDVDGHWVFGSSLLKMFSGFLYINRAFPNTLFFSYWKGFRKLVLIIPNTSWDLRGEWLFETFGSANTSRIRISKNGAVLFDSIGPQPQNNHLIKPVPVTLGGCLYSTDLNHPNTYPFQGIIKDAWIDVNGVRHDWALNTYNNELQPSVPEGSDMFIKKHATQNWVLTTV